MSWKIIITVVIIFLIIFLFAMSQPEAGRFFGSFFDKLNMDSGPSGSGNVIFTTDFEGYEPFYAKSTKKFNITVYANKFYTELGNGNYINTSDRVDFIGFTGSIFVENDNIIINGSYDSVKVEGAGAYGKGKISSTNLFMFAAADNLELNKLSFNSTKGSLMVNNVSFQLSSDRIEIGQPFGRFEFDPFNPSSSFRAMGSATYINVPGAGISIK